MEIKNYLNRLDPYRAKLDKAETERKARKAQSEGGPESNGDKISLSSEARLRTEAYSAASASSDFRADKVAEIKARVDAGEYEIDSRSIARGIIKEDLDTFM